MDRIELIMQSISEQYGAAFKMLENAIIKCQDELWNDPEAEKIISQVVYHILYNAEFYLTKNPVEEDDFKPEMDYEHGKNPKKIYTRQDLLNYLNFIRKKGETLFKSMTTEDLTTDSIFEWHGSSVLSSLLYNLRHIMLHIGALHVRLNKVGKEPMSWVSHSILYKNF